MKNFVQDGKSLDIILAGTMAAGDVILVGDLVGVLQDGGIAGFATNVRFTGVYALPKVTTGGSGIAQGTKVYWDDTAKKITATASTNKVAGYVWKVAADADATVAVRLLG